MNKVAKALTVTMHDNHATIVLKFLPIGGCFIDEYESVMMKIKSERCGSEESDLDQCVVLSGKQIGAIKEYSAETLVRFVDARLEIYK